MISFAPIEDTLGLEDYASRPHLAPAVYRLRRRAAELVPQLDGRRLWMVNSTAQGGGVAEMLPKMVTLLAELGVPTSWVVIGSDRAEFFDLTKRLHNLIHGHGTPQLTNADRELYDVVSEENARDLRSHLGPEDILVIHDPQPLGAGALLKRELGLPAVWRCHIGLDEHTPQTRAAWRFLEPYTRGYDHALFSAPEYTPDFLIDRTTIVHPGIDPLSDKNRDLTPHQLVGVLCNGGLKLESHPVLTPAYPRQAQRLRPDGTFGPAVNAVDIGLMYRPVVAQISRWDRLKGFAPLLDGFVRLKQRQQRADLDPQHRRRLEIARLVLGGPDPESVQDDPEGQEVLQELIGAYRRLPSAVQEDVALLSLPMGSRRENALMVNALQRCATVVVQNSLREGFGLTATEAMWKEVPTLGTHACGLRQQIRDGVDGLLVRDPEDSDEVAERLDFLLANVVERRALARNARRRVLEDFLIFSQVERWLEVLCCAVPAMAR